MSLTAPPGLSKPYIWFRLLSSVLLADMEWLVVKGAWRGAAGLVAWRRLFFVALAGMVVAGARVVVDGVSV